MEEDWPTEDDVEELKVAFLQAGALSEISPESTLLIDRFPHAVRGMGWCASHYDLTPVRAAYPEGISFTDFTALMRPRVCSLQQGAWAFETRSCVMQNFARLDQDGLGCLHVDLVQSVLEVVWGPLGDEEFNDILSTAGTQSDTEQELVSYEHVLDATLSSCGPPVPRLVRSALVNVSRSESGWGKSTEVFDALSNVLMTEEARAILEIDPSITSEDGCLDLNGLDRVLQGVAQECQDAVEACRVGPALIA